MIHDILIIGAGPAGYTAAEKAASAGLSTLLFEKNTPGGVCLNQGCIPTKTLLHSAKIFDTVKKANKYAIQTTPPTFDLPGIIARKNKVVRKLVAGVRMKMNNAGVETIQGKAIIEGITSNGLISVVCEEKHALAKHLVICTGSETILPAIPGLESTAWWTSEEALQVKELPGSLVVVGGGVIGMEFASFFNSLGVQVQVVEMMDEILPGMDSETAALLRDEYAKRGIRFHLKHKVVAVNETEVTVEKEGKTQVITGEKLLLSVGRRPVTEGFGMETLGLKTVNGRIQVNEHMQTSLPNVYACGDITGHSLLAHTAIGEAETAVLHLLGSPRPMSYRAIPAVVYTNPEIAGVGATEERLQQEGRKYTVKKLPLAFSGRFVAENELTGGLCKILLSEDGRVIGAHLLGNPASELVVIAGIAIEKGMSAGELESFVFPHPTVGEIIRETLTH
jgi:dihydrolipoamide dehydrogenase